MPPVLRLIIILAIIIVVVVIYGRMVGRKDPELRARPGQPENLNQADKDVISGLIGDNRKIEAIKYYRDRTGAGLVEAKRAIDTWFVPGVGLGMTKSAGGDGRLTIEARRRISELVIAGRREDAMTLYAEATGASDSEAQAIIRSWDTTENY